jgi:UDPglucose 6-dehydrogenase
MRISVIGCGYLGALPAASMATLGHEVVGIDVDQRTVEALSRAQPPFFEPGFADLLGATLASGRLRFSTDIRNAGWTSVHLAAAPADREEIHGSRS